MKHGLRERSPENIRKIRTLNILDDFNCEELAMEVSFSLPAESVIEVLTQYIECRWKLQKIRTANGSVFIALKIKEFFSKNQIDHIPIQKGKPIQNGYVVRFNRSYREGVHYAYILKLIDQAKEEPYEWIEDNNNNHSHESLGNKASTEYT